MAVNGYERPVAADYVTENVPKITVFDGPSWQSLALRRVLQLTIRPILQTWGALPNLPWPFGVIDKVGEALPPIKGTRHHPVQLPNCDAEWLRAPEVTNDDRVLLYLHGGAFICCGLNTHRRLLSMVSAACEAPALSVDYRMLPDTPISASVEDGLDGYRWLLDQGYRADQIVFAGDSAGGFLVLMTALLARERGLPSPAAIVCQSPFIDTDPCRKLEWLGDMLDPLFPANALIRLTELMTQVEAQRGHLYHGRVGSPLDADLSTLPPVLVQSGAAELLAVDAEHIAAQIADAGAICELELYEGQFHVFQAAADLVPEAADAIERIGAFVNKHIPA
ncbi:alpha/beta hydrolase [Aldersonia sp. NBC_00410]|uniref:alpha/beta hydrolase n=1 Tax=Aldersonia sp. NBC_00410 TaxID=2975954 RepID=UPI0022524B4B|nr:alpha/beta hydrolase [Aldersonia sp. NBC_00410]MCX5041832.1 alpha/beta hydrolase [Aldersonia sp. NBC_00410]